jgi:hypothetical protein
VRRHPPSTKAVVWLRRGTARALLVAKMETGRFNKRTIMVEYVMVALTIALLGTVYIFGGYGTNSQLAAPKASTWDARSEDAGPRIASEQLTRLIPLHERAPTL